MDKMKASAKKAWLEALRSGEYGQTRDAMADASGYCCLGVLVDVAIKADPSVANLVALSPRTGCEVRVASDQSGEGVFYDPALPLVPLDDQAELPEPVQEWAGLTSQDPHLDPNNPLLTAVRCNDGLKNNQQRPDQETVRRHSFAEIADLIEANIEAVEDDG